MAKRRLVIDLDRHIGGHLAGSLRLQIWSNYRYFNAHIAERAEGALNQHIGAIWRFHDSQFTQSQAIAKLIASQYRQSMAI